MECKLKSSVLGPWFPRDMRKRDVEISDPFGHFLPMAFLPLSNVCSPNLVYFPEYTLWACHIISVFLIYCCLWPHSFSFSFRTSDPCYWHLPFSGILPYHSMGFSTGSFFLPIVIPNGLHSINSQHLAPYCLSPTTSLSVQHPYFSPRIWNIYLPFVGLSGYQHRCLITFQLETASCRFFLKKSPDFSQWYDCYLFLSPAQSLLPCLPTNLFLSPDLVVPLTASDCKFW